MIVCGIDPGPKESAYVFWDGQRIVNHGYELNEKILSMLEHRFDGTEVVIEWIEGYGLTVGRETFDTCFWAGRFAQVAGEYHLLGRKAIKSHLCNTVKATDRDIRQALIDKLGEPGKKKAPGPTYGIVGDEWSALAAAVVWMETHQQP